MLTYHILGPKPRQERADRGACHHCGTAFPDGWPTRGCGR